VRDVESVGLLSGDALTGEDQCHGLFGANDPSENLRTSDARNQTKSDFGKCEAGSWRCDNDVGEKCKFEPSS
jgi:hypothetical protein